MPDRTDTAHTLSRYNLVAPAYDVLEWPMEHFLFRPWREALWDDVEGPTVLELGVGTGKNVPYYPAGVDVTAVDLSPKILRRARARAQRHAEKDVVLEQQDAQALEMPEASFDIVATFVFCSVPDPVQGLREALRVVRPGGRLRLLEHMRAEPEGLGRVMDRLDAPVHWITGVHIARRTVENVRKAGWVIDHVVPLSRGAIVRRIEAHRASAREEQRIHRRGLRRGSWIADASCTLL